MMLIESVRHTHVLCHQDFDTHTLTHSSTHTQSGHAHQLESILQTGYHITKVKSATFVCSVFIVSLDLTLTLYASPNLEIL